MKYLIIGNSPAGAYAARAIRQYDKEGTVTILTDEKTPFYSRPRLPEFLQGKALIQDMVIFKAFWYADNQIDLILNETAIQIDPAVNRVKTSSGKSFAYDKLLIAIGSVPDKIQVPGIDGSGIYTLRTVEDAIQIREQVAAAESIAVIGGGLLGLETAYSLASVSHSDVTVIEASDMLLPRQLDAEGAVVLHNLLTEKGLHFILGADIKSITDRNSKKVIEIADMRKVTADFIVVSTGIRIEKMLIKDTGIVFNKGICVNDYMESNISGIFAAGDCAEHKGRIYGLWTAATEQGRVAGSNMAGEKKVYEGTTPSTALKVAGIKLVSIGEIFSGEDSGYEEYKKIDFEEGLYKKLFIKKGILKGAILIGDISRKKQIEKTIGHPVMDYELV